MSLVDEFVANLAEGRVLRSDQLASGATTMEYSHRPARWLWSIGSPLRRSDTFRMQLRGHVFAVNPTSEGLIVLVKNVEKRESIAKMVPNGEIQGIINGRIVAEVLEISKTREGARLVMDSAGISIEQLAGTSPDAQTEPLAIPSYIEIFSELKLIAAGYVVIKERSESDNQKGGLTTSSTGKSQPVAASRQGESVSWFKKLFG